MTGTANGQAPARPGRIPSGHGLALAGLAAVVVGWWLPVRLLVPGLMLLTGPLVFRWARQGAAGVLWRAYTWGWAWCCWLAAPSGWFRLAALALLGLGLLADRPRSAAGWRAGWRRFWPLAPALAAAGLFLALMRVAAFGFTPSTGSASALEWAVLGAGLCLGFLSVAGAEESSEGAARRARIAGGWLALILAALAAGRAWNEPARSAPDPGLAPLAPRAASVEAAGFNPPPAARGPAWSKAAVVFGEGVSCLEARVTPSAVARGGSVAVRLAWTWDQPPDPAWRVFVHVRRNLYGGGLYEILADLPRAAPPGQPLGQELEVAVPADAPVGEYVVLVGLWNGRVNAPAVRAGACPPDWAVSRDGRVRVARVRVAAGAAP